MAVATSSQGEKARDVLDRAGLAAHMLAITGGNEVARGKPAPDVYLASIKKLVRLGGITGADDCIAFEDSEVGVRAALQRACASSRYPTWCQPQNHHHHPSI